MNDRPILTRRAVSYPLLVVFCLALSSAFQTTLAVMAEEHWPQFRGPGGSGVAPDGDFPVEFGPEKNVVWKLALPRGHSSPCVYGPRIFLTAFEDEKLVTLAIDRDKGGVLWRRAVSPGEMERGSRLSSPASSTPAADEKGVVVYFAPFGLIAYDHEGAEQWRRPLPTPITGHGASTSPVIARGLVVLLCDQDIDSHLLAVDRVTGKTRWKTERPGFRRGFSTPLAWPPESPEVVVLAGTLRLNAYDLANGTERWRVRGLPNEMVASPVAGGGMIFCAGWTHGSGVDVMPTFDELLEKDENGDKRLNREEASGPARRHFPYVDADKDEHISREEYESLAEIFEAAENALLAVRPDGSGDITESHVAWRATKQLPYVPSPLYYEGRVFLVKNGGIASCYDAKSGRQLYLGRLDVVGNYYASPVAAGGKICVAAERGTVVVLRSAAKLEVLARNDVGEAILASPAIVGQRLYLRTEKHLWVFGTSAAGATR